MYRWTFALLVVFSSVLQAGGWAPIPASTWDIREDAKAGIQGAIVLDEFARYGVRDSEFSLRILVLSEAGKSAVQLDPFPDELISLEGRTVLPDGRVVEFSKTKDFSEQTVDSNRFSSKRKVVVPPGVTSHCVLDIKWTLRSTYLWGIGLPGGFSAVTLSTIWNWSLAKCPRWGRCCSFHQVCVR